MRAPQAVLFDLDGTLIDSAPDLAGAANEMRTSRGLELLPFERFRPMVGAGARGMLGVALEVKPTDPQFNELREEFFRRYEARMTRETNLFPAMQPVLAALKRHRIGWGIVTNKSQRFTLPLVKALALDVEAGAVICGDSTPHSKPHPAPLLEAARRMNVDAAHCVYVGDDLRDVQAGKAAGMATIAAAWGYLGEGDPIEAWGADHVIRSPNELLNMLSLA